MILRNRGGRGAAAATDNSADRCVVTRVTPNAVAQERPAKPAEPASRGVGIRLW